MWSGIGKLKGKQVFTLYADNPKEYQPSSPIGKWEINIILSIIYHYILNIFQFSKKNQYL